MARSRQKSAKFSPAEAGGAVAQLGERLVRNEEVRGSTPLGSTSLRSLRELRLGRPVSAKSVASEGCKSFGPKESSGVVAIILSHCVAFCGRVLLGSCLDHIRDLMHDRMHVMGAHRGSQERNGHETESRFMGLCRALPRRPNRAGARGAAA